MTAPGADLRAAGLLRSWVEEAEGGLPSVADQVDLGAAELRAMLEGRELLPLSLIERILVALGREPATFFGYLYGSEPAEEGPGAPEEDHELSENRPLSRTEVEEIGREMDRVLEGTRRFLESRDAQESGSPEKVEPA